MLTISNVLHSRSFQQRHELGADTFESVAHRIAESVIVGRGSIPVNRFAYDPHVSGETGPFELRSHAREKRWQRCQRQVSEEDEAATNQGTSSLRDEVSGAMLVQDLVEDRIGLLACL